MRTICIINQKGGVGKTTTSVNLSAGLARQGKKVLLIDFDPQGNTSFSLSYERKPNLVDFIRARESLAACVMSLGKNLELLGTKESLAELETELSADKALFQKALDVMKGISGYDYVIIDCSPAMGTLNKLAILSSKEAIIPTTTDVLGLRGLSNSIKFISSVAEDAGHEIKVTKVVPTLYDMRNRICRETLEIMSNIYYDMITSPIRVNTKLKEAPKKHKSIFSYARSSRGAKDYAKLVNFVLNDEQMKLA